MKEVFTSVLACPSCGQPLDFEAAGYVCAAEQLRFSDRSGLPDFVAGDFTEPPPQERFFGMSRDNRIVSACRGAILALAPSHTYKTRVSRDRPLGLAQRLGSHGVGLNIGAGATQFGERVVNLDVAASDSLDALAVSWALPVRSESVDLVITQAALEHIRNTKETVEEAWRVLRPGGTIFCEVPFMQPYHGSPADYYRFTLDGLGEALTGFELVERGVAVGPSSAFSLMLRTYLSILLSAGHPSLHKAIAIPISWVCFPIKYLDVFLEQREGAHIMASGIYWIGHKRV